MKKKLTKSSNDIVLTGTLGGIAEYLGVDATILRIVYVIIMVCGIGSPILLYIALVAIIPQSPQKRSSYGFDNPYYKANNVKRPRKDVTNSAPKAKDDDWSDF
ncbi:phage shock protein C (PspC) family protein [Pilibacter termitis]|uniref:Phage shock protein C (PspC) family protein n=1 Tax=Pilibacter termitis TaxID=263852 RepID=A0A1T4MB69_9ENTE|nr:PspC domain-containing protein [Pilibacter termitis]SJZ64155.1 phage shock protein C (PspC) family protein [Pilibacter termitis]